MKAALLCLPLLAVQAFAPAVEITAEPHHHLVFGNKIVRVFNVQVDPNTETKMHWHRHDYISVNIGPAEIVNAVKGKPPATVKLADGDVRFASATFSHLVRDTADYPFRNVTVEILQDEALRKLPPQEDANKKEDHLLTNGTEKVLFIKDGIRATEFELQPGAAIPMHHHAGPHLQIAVTSLDLRSEVDGQGPTLAHSNPGDSKWFPANFSHTVINIGKQPAKFITLEFP